MDPNLSPIEVERWFSRLSKSKEKLTKLHLYLHDVVSGPAPSAVEVTKKTATTTTFFGLTRVFDDLVTESGSPDSGKFGYGQGTYTLTSQSDVRILFVFNFVFTEGKYKGSTLSLHGSNPIDQDYREMAIVGGSGVFRLATGSAVVSTHWRDKSTNDGIVDFMLFILHYEDDSVTDDTHEDGGKELSEAIMRRILMKELRNALVL